MQVIMNMEEYKQLEEKTEKLRAIRRLAKEILHEHSGKDDWAKPDDMQENMTFDETKLLLKRILE